MQYDNEVERARRKDIAKLVNMAVLSANNGNALKFDDEADDDFVTV